jgi:hypothetical protein
MDCFLLSNVQRLEGGHKIDNRPMGDSLRSSKSVKPPCSMKIVGMGEGLNSLMLLNRPSSKFSDTPKSAYLERPVSALSPPELSVWADLRRGRANHLCCGCDASKAKAGLLGFPG